MHALVLALCAAVSVGCKKDPKRAEREHGAELYGRMCAVCHGAAGEGYKADNATRLAQPDFLSSVSDEFLRVAISDGRRGTPMSAWAKTHGGPLENADVAALITFLRSWEKGPRAELDTRPNTGDRARGEEVFLRECVRCHGVRGATGPSVRIGNPQLLTTATNGFLRHAIRKGRPGTTMPAFETSLGNAGIEDVIAALRGWAVSLPPPAMPPAAPTHPPPLPLGPVPLNPKGPAPNGFKAYPDFTPVDVVKKELDRGARLALLDARAPSDYSSEHIAGAVSVPFYDPSPYLDKLPKDAWLVCYCSCPHAESGQLAQALTSKGFTKVTVLNEGLNVWKQRGYATHTGEQP